MSPLARLERPRTEGEMSPLARLERSRTEGEMSRGRRAK
jgi:hypothetical protein